jgi:hypothetical protein
MWVAFGLLHPRVMSALHRRARDEKYGDDRISDVFKVCSARQESDTAGLGADTCESGAWRNGDAKSPRCDDFAASFHPEGTTHVSG